MHIAGMQKLTLLDFPGVVACTIFTSGCNFRCPFCHNASLVLPQRHTDYLEETAVLAYLQRRKGILDGVTITGGEPLLQPDLAPFLKEIRAMGYQIKLDTNGAFPDALIALVDAGLVDKVAMDLKNAPEQYEKTTGSPVDLDALTRTKAFLLSGRVDYEFRTTLVRGLHTDESVRQAAKWICGAKAYYLQQYQDSGDVIAPEGLNSFTETEMKRFAHIASEFVPAVQIRGL